MIFDIPVNFEINADSEKEAKQRLQKIFQYLMRVERRELGLENWEYIKTNVQQTTNSS